jgi:hypothetical protein
LKPIISELPLLHSVGSVLMYLMELGGFDNENKKDIRMAACAFAAAAAAGHGGRSVFRGIGRLRPLRCLE